jgi:FtsH-binding integral membrane protein
MVRQPDSGTSSDTVRRRRKASPAWYLLLLAPFVGVLWVPFFNSIEPSWAGIPFFYWYQFLWVLISSALTLIVYFATRDEPADGE